VSVLFLVQTLQNNYQSKPWSTFNTRHKTHTWQQTNCAVIRQSRKITKLNKLLTPTIDNKWTLIAHYRPEKRSAEMFLLSKSDKLFSCHLGFLLSAHLYPACRETIYVHLCIDNFNTGIL
jgi:hypothetical protein